MAVVQAGKVAEVLAGLKTILPPLYLLIMLAQSKIVVLEILTAISIGQQVGQR